MRLLHNWNGKADEADVRLKTGRQADVVRDFVAQIFKIFLRNTQMNVTLPGSKSNTQNETVIMFSKQQGYTMLPLMSGLGRLMVR